jgi:hypothetical protein
VAIDWDAEVLSPVMELFGEGDPVDPSTWPTYTPRGLTGFQLADAVFDAEYEQVDVNPDDGTTSTSHRPVLGVRVSLFPRKPAQNDTVFIPSVAKTYVVRDVQPDGHGHAKLMLMETAS